jgi:hypothetical protein
MADIKAPVVTLDADGNVGNVQLDVRVSDPAVQPLPEEFQPVNPFDHYKEDASAPAAPAPAAAPEK